MSADFVTKVPDPYRVDLFGNPEHTPNSFHMRELIFFQQKLPDNYNFSSACYRRQIKMKLIG